MSQAEVEHETTPVAPTDPRLPEQAPGRRPGKVGPRRWEPYVFSLPVLLFLAAFFIIPLLRLVVLTFWVPGVDGGRVVSLDLYQQLLSDEFNRSMIYRTIRLSALTTFVTLVLAYPIALWMRELPARWRGVVAILMLSPLLMSVVVRTLGWVILLAPRGVINTYLTELGLSPGQFLYNERAVILGLTHVFLGYMVLSLLTSMMQIQDNVIYAAFNLGATRLRALRDVVFPMSLPGVAAGCVLVFSLSASAYVTPVLLGGSQTHVMATRVYQLSIVYLEFDEAAVFATVLFLLIAAVVWGVTKLTESGKRKVIFR